MKDTSGLEKIRLSFPTTKRAFSQLGTMRRNAVQSFVAKRIGNHKELKFKRRLARRQKLARTNKLEEEKERAIDCKIAGLLLPISL